MKSFFSLSIALAALLGSTPVRSQEPLALREATESRIVYGIPSELAFMLGHAQFRIKSDQVRRLLADPGNPNEPIELYHPQIGVNTWVESGVSGGSSWRTTVDVQMDQLFGDASMYVGYVRAEFKAGPNGRFELMSPMIFSTDPFPFERSSSRESLSPSSTGEQLLGNTPYPMPIQRRVVYGIPPEIAFLLGNTVYRDKTNEVRRLFPDPTHPRWPVDLYYARIAVDTRRVFGKAIPTPFWKSTVDVEVSLPGDEWFGTVGFTRAELKAQPHGGYNHLVPPEFVRGEPLP